MIAVTGEPVLELIGRDLSGWSTQRQQIGDGRGHGKAVKGQMLGVLTRIPGPRGLEREDSPKVAHEAVWSIRVAQSAGTVNHPRQGRPANQGLEQGSNRSLVGDINAS